MTQDTVNYETIDLDRSLTQESVDYEMEDFETYLTQVSITSVNSVDSESKDVDTCLVQDLQENLDDTEVPIEFVEGKIDNYSTEPSSTHESEEETDFQSRDECKTVELKEEQKLEECLRKEVDSETVRLTDIPIAVIY